MMIRVSVNNATQHSVRPTPDKVRRGRDGGTAAGRDCVRVFRQLRGLELVPLK
jgi:hypothetical protein